MELYMNQSRRVFSDLSNGVQRFVIDISYFSTQTEAFKRQLRLRLRVEL